MVIVLLHLLWLLEEADFRRPLLWLLLFLELTTFQSIVPHRHLVFLGLWLVSPLLIVGSFPSLDASVTFFVNGRSVHQIEIVNFFCPLISILWLNNRILSVLTRTKILPLLIKSGFFNT
jgi:hypothetical protein